MIRREIEIIKEWLLGVDFISFWSGNKYKIRPQYHPGLGVHVYINSYDVNLDAKIKDYTISLYGNTSGEEAAIEKTQLTILKGNRNEARLNDFNTITLSPDEKEMMNDVLISIFKHIQQTEEILEQKKNDEKIMRDTEMLAEVTTCIKEGATA